MNSIEKKNQMRHLIEIAMKNNNLKCACLE